MAELTHTQYDALERAIIDQRRIAVYRRGTEYVVVPRALRLEGRQEVIEATHPTTGEAIEFSIADLESIQVIA
ncbi:MAG TPA: hypothetical protein VFW98_15125 [Gemmatimonadaceae bacterium]|nr:hypothetical protein [Gemmatimonadaceae bacterium]